MWARGQPQVCVVPQKLLMLSVDTGLLARPGLTKEARLAGQ